MHPSFPRYIYLSIVISPALGRVVPARRDDSSTKVDSTQFEADSSINVAALYDYVKSGKGGSVMASYPTCNGELQLCCLVPTELMQGCADCDAVNVNIVDQSSAVDGAFTFLADMVCTSASTYRVDLRTRPSPGC